MVNKNFEQTTDNKNAFTGDEKEQIQIIKKLFNQPLDRLESKLGHQLSKLEQWYNEISTLVSRDKTITYPDLALPLQLGIQPQFIFVPPAPNANESIRYLYDNALLEIFESYSNDLKIFDNISTKNWGPEYNQSSNTEQFETDTKPSEIHNNSVDSELLEIHKGSEQPSKINPFGADQQATSISPFGADHQKFSKSPFDIGHQKTSISPFNTKKS